jgi:uncharacterized protein (DUF433 family)
MPNVTVPPKRGSWELTSAPEKRGIIGFMVDWRQRISVNPAVCHGKACIRGTRVTVSVLLDNVAAGTPTAKILDSYPSVTEADLHAALAYAAELAREGSVDLPLETKV